MYKAAAQMTRMFCGNCGKDRATMHSLEGTSPEGDVYMCLECGRKKPRGKRAASADFVVVRTAGVEVRVPGRMARKGK